MQTETSEFFSSLDLALRHNDFYGAFKPVMFGGAEHPSESESCYFSTEARNPHGIVVMRGYNALSIASAIGDIMRRPCRAGIEEIDRWVQEGNSFLFTKTRFASLKFPSVGATRLLVYRGTETLEQNLLRSYGGDSPYIAYINFANNVPKVWQ